MKIIILNNSLATNSYRCVFIFTKKLMFSLFTFFNYGVFSVFGNTCVTYTTYYDSITVQLCITFNSLYLYVMLWYYRQGSTFPCKTFSFHDKFLSHTLTPDFWSFIIFVLNTCMYILIFLFSCFTQSYTAINYWCLFDLILKKNECQWKIKSNN